MKPRCCAVLCLSLVAQGLACGSSGRNTGAVPEPFAPASEVRGNTGVSPGEMGSADGARAGGSSAGDAAPEPDGEGNGDSANLQPVGNGNGATITSGADTEGGASTLPADDAADGASLQLPRSTPEAQGVSSGGVRALVEALDSEISEVHSLMLARHGQVIAEGFWAPYAPGDVHVLYSVSKSVNATAVGIAAEEGLLSLDDTVLSHFPDLAPAQVAPQMQQMRIEDLLMMASGHQNDTMDTLRARTDGQWTRAFLETNVENAPGSTFVYNSGASYMLSAIVQRVTGTTVEEYLEPRLFQPLGIARHIWGQSPEGVNLAGGGLALTTEALVKFGQLYLDGGEFNGQRVLSEGWVAAASAEQISTGNYDNNWGYGYGYQFWRNAEGGYRADGSLGQFVFILPQQDIVLAITSATNDTDGIMNLVWQHLLPAVQAEAGLADAPQALEQLQASLSSLALPLPEGTGSSPLASEVSGRRYAANGNGQGITGVTLDFSAGAVLVVEDGDGVHRIALGSGEWLRGRTGFKSYINELFATPEQAVAASGAWEAEDTFVARIAFNETPYVLTTRMRFQGEQVFIDMSYNIRWGNATEPQIVASR